MGIFTGAGMARGNLAFNDRTNKRRSELASLFEEFKRNNPYATAQDYNTYIEGLVGPQEMYLRGNLPAGQILERMGQDNQQRKARDEHREQVEVAAKDLAVRGQLQNLAGDMVLNNTDDEIYEALAQYMPGASAEEREQSLGLTKSMLGDVGRLRETKRQELFDSQIDEAVKMIHRTNGLVPVEEIMSKLKARFPNQNLPALKNYADQLKREVIDNHNIKLSENKSRLQGEIRSVITAMDANPRLPYQLTPGSDEYQVGLDWIEEQIDTLQFFGKPEEIAAQKAELRDRMIKQAQGTRTTILGKERKANVAQLTETLTKSMQADYESQQAQMENKLIQAGIKEDSPQHGILKEAATRWEIPAQLENDFINFLVQESYSDPVSAVDEWYASLPDAEKSSLMAPHQFRGAAMQQAGKFYPEQQDAKTFMSSMQSALKQQQSGDKATVDHFRGIVNSPKPTYHGVKKAIADIDRVILSVDARQRGYETKVERHMSNTRNWLIGHEAIDPNLMATELTGAQTSLTGQTMSQLQELRRQAANKLQYLSPKNEFNASGSQEADGTSTSVPLATVAQPSGPALPPPPGPGSTREDWIAYYQKVERIEQEYNRNSGVKDKQDFMRATQQAKAAAAQNIQSLKADGDRHRNATDAFLNARPYYGD